MSRHKPWVPTVRACLVGFMPAPVIRAYWATHDERAVRWDRIAGSHLAALRGQGPRLASDAAPRGPRLDGARPRKRVPWRWFMPWPAQRRGGQQ